jgi:protein-tyrosine phosphatase
MKRLLFVCMGNICRSPAGEGVMQALVNARGLQEKISIDSAGTINYHTGHRADKRMQQAANRRGYELLSRARQITREDCLEFDLIVAMDRENLAYCQNLSKEYAGKMRLLSDFLAKDATDNSGAAFPEEVPDPYYGGEAGFEFVLDMIEQACPNIMESLVAE